MTIRFESRPAGILPSMDLSEQVARRAVDLDSSLRSAFVATGPAEANLDRLFEEPALCVTSGQQPGLLTGPLYTIYKALSTAALARLVEERLARPVIPVFWVAADDHDFAEVNHCVLPSSSNDVVRIALRERDEAAHLTPMYKEQLGSDIDLVLTKLEAHTPETEFRPEILEWIRAHYRSESDLASAFGGALAELLGKYGVVVFLPTCVQAKRAMAPWLMSALEKASEIDRELAVRAEYLQSQGNKAPISVGGSASTVFIESKLGRDRLLLEEGAFLTRRAKEVWTLSELSDVAELDPQRLSPNVLLRPVVEAALLPTIAYVGGPGELDYLPQAEPIYRVLGVEPQLAVPRWSGLCVDRRTDKFLAKHGINVDDLAMPEGQLEARILRDELPEDATEAMALLRANLAEQYARLAIAAESVDQSLGRKVKAAEHGALKDLSGLEKRILNQLKQQNETTVRQLVNARNSLFPLGRMQERVFNSVPYLIRYGDEFLEKAYGQCRNLFSALETATGES